MRRKAPPGEFRSNIHRGGSTEATKLLPEERKMALAAVRAMGLNVAGVDMLRAERGPLVVEVNSSPGLEGIEIASEKDVAGAIIEFIENNAAKGAAKDRVKG